MCLINLRFHDHPNYKLIVAANRDEFYSRPTAPAQFWEDEPGLLAGRDLLQMGTWLGITRSGRFASLTNFRDPTLETVGKKSRGDLVRAYLTGTESPQEFLSALDGKDYSGFNVILGNPDELLYYNNIEGSISKLPPGVHGLSNHFLNTSWPKVIKGTAGLKAVSEGRETVETEELFMLLADAEQARNDELPHTGVGHELEKQLSPLFIRIGDYGTRSSTVLTIGYDNQVMFTERIYENGEAVKENTFTFKLEQRMEE